MKTMKKRARKLKNAISNASNIKVFKFLLSLIFQNNDYIFILHSKCKKTKHRTKYSSCHGKTSERDNFYPLTHLKRHFDFLRSILNKDTE